MPPKGYKQSKEAKEKISIFNKGKKLSSITKKKIGIALKGKLIGKNNPMWGRTREKNSSWKGGRSKSITGYVSIYIGNGKYIFEHRLVMERHLKRKLEIWEQVHHRNGVKDDNRLENLEIVLSKFHFGQVRCPHCLEDFLIK